MKKIKNNVDLLKKIRELRKRVRKHTGIFSTKFPSFFGKRKEVILKKAEWRIWNVFVNLMDSISWTLHLDKMKELKYGDRHPLDQRGCGDMVVIRPCDKKYKKKTYLGIYLGDMALSIHHTIKDNIVTSDFAMHNPAIYVPDIKKVIFGCGSWWSRIKNKEDLKQITDKDIDNVWYVRTLKELGKKK